MLSDWQSWATSQAKAGELLNISLVQELWSGYGELLRLRFQNGSFILKRVVWAPGQQDSISDQRKRRSYQVEQTFYREVAPTQPSRVARCVGQEWSKDGCLLLLEDLAEAGYHPDPNPNPERTRAGLSWLAHFHARFLGQEVTGLWEQGCYWHLDTRQTEWQRMSDGPLKQKARALDSKLRQARHQTLVHGDAKTPNFCWDANNQAAAVDFQYVGKGPGIRDVALFLERALGRHDCQTRAARWLDLYFELLKSALGVTSHPVEQEWRDLYPIAWSDYSRFRQGWAMHSDLDPYSREQLDLALKTLS